MSRGRLEGKVAILSGGAGGVSGGVGAATAKRFGDFGDKVPLGDAFFGCNFGVEALNAGEAGGSAREAVVSAVADAQPPKRLARPDKPTNAIVFPASDRSSFTTGADIPVDGGFLA